MDPKQGHDYMRHSFGLYVQWFTFFGTVNVAILGWLAKADTLKWIAITVCTVFLVNNVIAAIGTTRVLGHLDSAAKEIIAKEGLSEFPPIAMYRNAIKLMRLGMWVNVPMWIATGIIFYCR